MTTAEELRKIADQLERASTVAGLLPKQVVVRVKDPASLIDLMRRAAEEADFWSDQGDSHDQLPAASAP